MRKSIDDNTKETGRMAGLVDGCVRALEEHVANCPARNGKNNSTTIVPSRYGLAMVGMIQRWAPLIFAAAIGLVGLGMYWGSMGDIEAKVQKLETLTKAMKVQQ